VKDVAPEFSQMMDTAQVFEKLEKENSNFTLFVAGDDTLEDLTDHLQEVVSFHWTLYCLESRDQWYGSNFKIYVVIG